jgi:hypothetical protein
MTVFELPAQVTMHSINPITLLLSFATTVASLAHTSSVAVLSSSTMSPPTHASATSSAALPSHEIKSDFYTCRDPEFSSFTFSMHCIFDEAGEYGPFSQPLHDCLWNNKGTLATVRFMAILERLSR